MGPGTPGGPGYPYNVWKYERYKINYFHLGYIS
jgi:hypothetical protein